MKAQRKGQKSYFLDASFLNSVASANNILDAAYKKSLLRTLLVCFYQNAVPFFL